MIPLFTAIPYGLTIGTTLSSLFPVSRSDHDFFPSTSVESSIFFRYWTRGASGGGGQNWGVIFSVEAQPARSARAREAIIARHPMFICIRAPCAVRLLICRSKYLH